MKNFENVRMDYEDTIAGAKFEDGKFLHVKEENGDGAILVIRQRTGPQNECLFKGSVVKKTSGVDASKFGHYATTSEMEPYLTADHVTFTVTDNTDNVLEISNLSELPVVSTYERFMVEAGRRYSVNFHTSGAAHWVNLRTTVARNGTATHGIVDGTYYNPCGEIPLTSNDDSENSSNGTITAVTGAEVGAELRRSIQAEVEQELAMNTIIDESREAAEADRRTRENNSITSWNTRTYADRHMIFSEYAEAAYSIANGECDEHPVGDNYTMRGEADENGNITITVSPNDDSESTFPSPNEIQSRLRANRRESPHISNVHDAFTQWVRRSRTESAGYSLEDIDEDEL